MPCNYVEFSKPIFDNFPGKQENFLVAFNQGSLKNNRFGKEEKSMVREMLKIGEKYLFQHQHLEVYTEPSKIFKMEQFSKIVNSFLAFTIFAKHSILDLLYGSEYASCIII